MEYYGQTEAGTPIYMAPEALAMEDFYTTSADMWSLGAVISFCCNREHPLTDTASVYNWRGGNSTLDAYQYSSGLRRLVANLLSPNAKKRPSASQVLQETLKNNRQRTDID